MPMAPPSTQQLAAPQDHTAAPALPKRMALVAERRIIALEQQQALLQRHVTDWFDAGTLDPLQTRTNSEMMPTTTPQLDMVIALQLKLDQLTLVNEDLTTRLRRAEEGARMWESHLAHATANQGEHVVKGEN